MKKIVFAVLLLIAVQLGAAAVFAADISVYLNGEKIDCGSNAPYIKNGRTMVPAKAVFGAMGADVEWEPIEKKVIVTRNVIKVVLQINNNSVTISESSQESVMLSDVAPEIKNGSTFVPLAIVSGSLGCEASWNAEEKAVYLSAAPTYAHEEAAGDSLSYNGITIALGSQAAALHGKLEAYSNQSSSVYNFAWQEYSEDLSGFMLVGVDNSEVVALFSNSENVSIGGIRSGMSAAELQRAAGRELALENKTVIPSESGILIVYRDSLNDFAVKAVMAQKPGYNQSVTQINNTFYNEQTVRLLESIINTERHNQGLGVLEVSDRLRSVAAAHSADMAANGYSGTVSREGKNALDRLSEADITNFNMAAENVGRGYADPIDMYMEWVNDKHDSAVLFAENMNTFGVGVSQGGAYKMYYTAIFLEENTE